MQSEFSIANGVAVRRHLITSKEAVTVGLRTSPRHRAVFHSRRLSYECLENRRLLAIDWANRGADNFGALGANATLAREIVDRAINDWAAVIADFNYDGDDDPRLRIILIT